MDSRRIVLRFPKRLVDKPVISKLIREFDLEFNLLKAYITPREEGMLVLELSGSSGKLEDGLEYLREIGVIVLPLQQEILRNVERCTHCGACVTCCPAGALKMDPVTRNVQFYDNKCIACELCIRSCPLRAIEVHF